MSKIHESKDPVLHEANLKRHFALRLNIFFFSAFLLFSILVVRLAFLQFVESDAMRMLEESNSTISTPIAPIRGNIFDRNGYPIAYTESTQSLYFRVEPGQSKESVIQLAYDLAELFEKSGDPSKPLITSEEILKKMDVGYDLNQNRTKDAVLISVPRRIKEGLSQREVAYLLEHKDELKGLEITEESVRRYDSNTIATQLIGYMREHSTAKNQSASYLVRYKDGNKEYTNDEYVGFDGLEFLYQDVLRGTNGSKTYPVNAQQKIVGQVDIKFPQKGHNLTLSLHKDVQLLTEEAIINHINWMKSDEAKLLKTPYQGKNAVAGYAVAMEVKTGHVVAMASMPDYDSNVWRGGINQATLDLILQQIENGTIRERRPDLSDEEIGKHPSSVVPLGSTIKPLTVLIGLSEGLITPKSTYQDKGVFIYGRDESKVRNSGSHVYGLLTPTTAIQKSSNTFMSAMIGNKLYMSSRIKEPLDVWDSYMKQFGLGVSTESDLPGEQNGTIEYYNTVKNSSEQAALVFASFGQQGKYTTLQLAQYVTMLANRGKRLKPQFVTKITDYEDHVVEEFTEPIILNEIDLPDEYWSVIENGMVSGVKGFEGFPYSFRRKTGTSESDIAGQKLDNAVFIAYAPAENPKLAVAVIVPEGGFGAQGAAPIARQIFDAYDKYVGLTDEK
ncbi:MAG: penicillin-binding transpeptidase domain-containing protein [Paenibacillaceae bacterium]